MSAEAGQQFDGGVFNETVEGGRAAASVSLTSGAVVATTADGQLFAVSYEGAILTLGGASGKMWFCRSADGATTIFSEASGFADALRASSQKDLVERLDAIEQAARDAKQRYFWLFTGIVMLLIFLGTLGMYIGRHAGPLVLKGVPVSFDKKLGKLALETMDLGGEPSTDKVMNDAVKRVVERLSKVQKSPFRFEPRVVQSPLVNAFALPGGPIIIHTGLLREAKSAEQLAGVLAHEMAHVVRRHGLARITQSLGAVAVIQLMFGDVSGVMAVAVELLRAGAINTYSRADEHEADMDAVDRMRLARLDGNALADFFQRLARKESESELPTLPEWLGTHPDLKRRIHDVRERVARAHEVDPVALNIDWAEVRRHAGTEPDDDK